MYGRQAKLPIDLELKKKDNNTTVVDLDDVYTSMQENRKEIIKHACENIQKAQCRQKRLYDMKRTSSEYSVGSFVLLKNNKNMHRMGGKLDPKWSGPYSVHQDLGKGCLKLKNSSGNILKNTYHACNLKRYYPLNSNAEEWVCNQHYILHNFENHYF